MTVGNWALFIAAVLGLNVIGGKARALVRKNAPFYAVKNILIVGGNIWTCDWTHRLPCRES
jgi:hypothetical protein